jgi:hypothetical protein
MPAHVLHLMISDWCKSQGVVPIYIPTFHGSAFQGSDYVDSESLLSLFDIHSLRRVTTRTMSPEETQALLDGPALARPEGAALGMPNEGNHTLGYVLVILSAVLCTLSVAVRLVSRYSMKKIGIEDAFVVCALVYSLLLSCSSAKLTACKRLLRWRGLCCLQRLHLSRSLVPPMESPKEASVACAICQ